MSKFLNSEIAKADETAIEIASLEQQIEILKMQLQAVTEHMMNQAIEIARLKVEIIQTRLAYQLPEPENKEA